MKVEIITIGEELLIGQITDTNSAWIAGQMNRLGFETVRITSISDKKEDIEYALTQARKKADIVLITGGLGPTNDDITKPALCNFFSTQLSFNQQVYNDIETLLKSRGKKMLKVNKLQAKVPESAKIIRNRQGTAPALWFEKEDTVFIAMPGVPYEMKTLMQEKIIPAIKNKYLQNNYFVHKLIYTTGIAESMLADSLKEWEKKLPENISVAYLPSPGLNKIRLDAKGNNEAELNKLLEKQIKKIEKRIPEHFLGIDKPEILISKLLKNKHATLSTAESCSGGHLAHTITSVSGSSKYYQGSIIAYSNAIKQKILGVNPEMIKKQGAVSQQVVEQMAQGVRQTLGTTYSISTSGIAGPAGGSTEKPVGTVWIAVASEKEVVAKKYNFGNSRERNIIRTSYAGLNMLRWLLQK